MEGGERTIPTIRVQREGGPERIIPLDTDRFLIGRSKMCEIILNEPTVSGRHARLVRGPDGVFSIEDLESHNNTYVDGQPIQGQGAIRLSDGQAFRICDFWLIYKAARVQIEEREPSSSSIRRTRGVGSTQEGTTSSRPEDALRGILELIRAVGPSLRLDEVLDKVLESLFVIFPQADRGYIHLTDRGPTGPDLVPSWSRSRTHSQQPYSISRTVLREVLEKAVAFCCDDVSGDGNLAESDSLAISGIRSMVCAPILDRDGTPVGIVQLDAFDLTRPFDEGDLDLLLAMLGPIGVAVENARMHDEIVRRRQRDHDAHNAREVQQALLPERPPSLPGYTFWHYYEPAFEVGGDYFGYVPGSPGSTLEASGKTWTISVGDVTGKGMRAALLMAKLSAEVQVALISESDPAGVLGRLNRRIAEADLPDSFITFVLLVLDVDRHRLSISGAGHPCPVIRRADGRLESVANVPQGPPLGVLPEATFEPVSVDLAPGDLVVVYSDGATDAIDRETRMFGTQALLDAIAAGPGTPELLGPALIDRITRFSEGAPQADDITLICFGREPFDPPAPPRPRPGPVRPPGSPSS